MDNHLKEKNKIDLKYNTYLQFFNTIIIITATVLITVSIAIFTEQIKIGKNITFIFVMCLSLTVIIFTTISLIIIYNKMKENLEDLNNL